MIEHPRAVDNPAAFRIVRAEDQAADARVADGSGAHRAGLQRHHQGQPGQAIIAEPRGRFAQGENLGVGGGIAAADRGVAGLGHHLARRWIDHHRADRRFTGLGGGLRAGEGDAHGGDVMTHASDPNAAAASGQAEDAGEAENGRGDRVAKVLARAGVASRREVERLIAAGRVRLNGAVLETPAVKVGADDVLAVDGRPVTAPEGVRVWRYHKPAGLVTTHSDPQGRPTVFAHLPAELPRVISVGRLDLSSEGLLLLTNDGELARALELPANRILRRYRARARGRTTQEALDRLKDGIVVDGVQYGPIEAVLEDGAASGVNRWISVTLTEGKNREVRNVLAALDLSVNRLIRLTYGPFDLGTLAAGEVAEVEPRVIRERLGRFIDPQNLPTPGARAAAKAKPRATASRPGPPPEKTTYKTGWAKPKKRGGSAKPKATGKDGKAKSSAGKA